MRNGTPRVSVIIPAYFSYSTLAACLKALQSQSFHDFEVIVVNSSPEEKTRLIIEAECPTAVFIQSRERLLPHAARNVGIQQAKGELLVFSDPDCQAEQTWLQHLLAAYDAGQEALVGAMGLAGHGYTATGIHLCKFHWLLPNCRPASKSCAPTANAAFSKKLWSKIGPFPGDVFAGDGVVSLRARRLGHAPSFIPNAIIRHHHTESLPNFCRQRFARGKEFAYVQFSHMELHSILDWLRLAFSWTALGLVLLRAARDAKQAHWGWLYCKTLPVHATGHLFWALGESWGAVTWVFVKQGRRKCSLV